MYVVTIIGLQPEIVTEIVAISGTKRVKLYILSDTYSQTHLKIQNQFITRKRNIQLFFYVSPSSNQKVSQHFWSLQFSFR